MVRKNLRFFMLFITIGVLLTGLVLAIHVIRSSAATTSASYREDIQFTFNITVNNTDSVETGNITQLNITLPSGFVYKAFTNYTDTLAFAVFTNTSSVLTWQNFTNWIINQTSAALSYFWVNLSQATPGQYNISITTLNATRAYFSNISVIINDTTAPSSIEFTSPTNATMSNLSLSSITYNISVIDNGVLSTIRILVWNATGLLNSSSSVSSDVSTSANFAGLSDGIYYLNASANDTYNNVNWTTTNLTIILDRTAPSVSFSCSPTQIQVRGTVTCSCSGSDATSGVKTTSYTVNPSTATSGEYTTSCQITDHAGNSQSSSIAYVVTSSASSGGGGGGSSSATTTEITSSQFSSGYTKSLGTNEQIKFSVNNQSHYALVQSLTTSSATIKVTSDPQTATLAIGEEKKFDLTGDRVYDLSVKLNSISGSSASITVKSITEQMPAETVSQQSTETTQETAEETAPSTTSLSPSVIIWIILAIIVVLVIILIVYFSYKKKR